MGEEALVQLSRDEETTLNVFTNSNRQILLVLPLIPVKHPLMIFCKSAKTAHISTPVVLPLWRAFETPRRHPKCLANEIRLTPMGVSLGTGVQGTAVWVFECLCICALYGCHWGLVASVRGRGVDYGITGSWWLPIVPIARDHCPTETNTGHAQKASWNRRPTTGRWVRADY